MKNAYLMLLLSALLFATCSKESSDPCEGIICENGGTCVNGICDCPDGWEGADCTEVATPSAITINFITVTRFPPTTPTGGGWDTNNGPDLIVKLSNGSGNIYESDIYHEDALYTQQYGYNTNIRITNVQQTLQIGLYDYDFIWGEELIETYNFKIFNDGQTIDKTNLILDSSDKTAAFEFKVSYEY